MNFSYRLLRTKHKDMIRKIFVKYNNFNKFKFSEFVILGQEQAYKTKSIFKKTIISTIGILPINPRIRSGRIISEIFKQTLPYDANILDAGFGHGLAMFYLSRNNPNWKITGYEIDEKHVLDAKKIKDVIELKNLVIKKINLVEIKDYSTYDLIYSCDVLEHIEDDVKTLENFHKALKPAGKLILHLPFRYSLSKRVFPWFNNYKTSDHVRDEYTVDEITKKLLNTGFRIDLLSFGYGRFKGELAFELNNFLNFNRLALILSQLSSYPLAICLGFLDIKNPPKVGNSLVIISTKQE